MSLAITQFQVFRPQLRALRQQWKNASRVDLDPEQPFQVLKPDADAQRFLSIAKHSADYRAWLGLSADKSAFVDQHGGAILFAKRPLHWIALAQPMGKTAHSDDLLRAFISASKQAMAELVFYQAPADFLPQLQALSGTDYVAYKLGEEALVHLDEFSLQGSARSKLRNFCSKAQREGWHFEITAIPDDALLVQCKAISERWLAAKQGKEKQFSLGGFSVPYLKQMPMAVVRQGEKVLAFANLLQSATLQVLSVDSVSVNLLVAFSLLRPTKLTTFPQLPFSLGSND